MPQITAGSITAFFLFDVAEAIDPSLLQKNIGAGVAEARFVPKSGAPSYFQYAVPPLVVDGATLGVPSVDGFNARFKFFDSGVVSLALTRPFTGDWPELVTLAQRYIENEALEREAETSVRAAVRRIAGSFTAFRSSDWLSEDYLVLSVTALEARLTAEQLLNQRSAEIALLVRGEQHALSPQEQDDILRNRLSYLADDLVVPTWNAAFVYDSDAGAQAALEIFEFANSQLLEFRYYDELLERELKRIYAQLQQRQRYAIAGRGYIKATHQLHALFIDVNEITDRTQNALKMIGDIYAARLFQLVAARLGLGMWKASVEDKLKTLDDIYRFAVEQVAIARGQLLELTIVLILVFELVLFFAGIM